MENLRPWVPTLKWLSKFFVVLTAASVGLFVASQAQAVVFGVSPAEIQGVIRQGDVVEDSFSLSRNDNSFPMTFRTQAPDEGNVEFLKDEVTIETGESSVRVPFTFDASELEPGEYSPDISFTPVEQPGTGSGPLRIIFAVGARLKFEVVDRERYDELLETTPILLQNVFLTEQVINPREPVELNLLVSNRSNVYVSELNSILELYNTQGELVAEGELQDVSLGPQRSDTFTALFPGQKPGEYTARVALNVGGRNVDQTQVPVTIRPASTSALWIVLVLIVLILLTSTGVVCRIRFSERRGKKKKKHIFNLFP